MKNKIEDLRNHLFTQLERLSDEDIVKNEKSLKNEIDRSKAIIEVADILIKSASAETEFLRITSGTNQILESDFFFAKSLPQPKK